MADEDYLGLNLDCVVDSMGAGGISVAETLFSSKTSVMVCGGCEVVRLPARDLRGCGVGDC